MFFVKSTVSTVLLTHINMLAAMVIEYIMFLSNIPSSVVYQIYLGTVVDQYPCSSSLDAHVISYRMWLSRPT